MNIRPRDVRLDFVRTVAIMSIIWIHSMEQSPLESLKYGNTVLYLFGRMGVPLFLMLTGATMIDREYESLMDFYVKKLLPIYLVSVLWCFIYGGGTKDITTNIVNSLKIVASAKHLWYFPILLQLYAVLPFLSYIKKLTDLDIICLLLFSICFSWLVTFKIIPMVSGNMVSFGYIYVIYGYLCYDRKIYNKLSTLLWLILFAVSVFLFVWTDWNPIYQSFFTNLGLDIWWYYSPFLMLAALTLYPLLLKMKSSCRFFTVISKCAFGMFVVHLFFIQIIGVYIDNIAINILKTVVLFILVFGCSLVISFIVGKIPCIKKAVWQ